MSWDRSVIHDDRFFFVATVAQNMQRRWWGPHLLMGAIVSSYGCLNGGRDEQG